MFDIGMSEMAVIGVVALIVVGPKDLPGMFRTVGQFVGKAKGMARDFQRAMDDAADDSGVSGLSNTLKQATSMKNLGLDKATESFQNYQKNFEPKKVDAAAEHAKRVKAKEDANKAGAQWPPEGVDIPVVETSEVVSEAPKAVAKKPAAKKTAAKKAPAKKPAAKKVAAKKPAAKSTKAKI